MLNQITSNYEWYACLCMSLSYRIRSKIVGWRVINQHSVCLWNHIFSGPNHTSWFHITSCRFSLPERFRHFYTQLPTPSSFKCLKWIFRPSWLPDVARCRPTGMNWILMDSDETHVTSGTREGTPLKTATESTESTNESTSRIHNQSIWDWHRLSTRVIRVFIRCLCRNELPSPGPNRCQAQRQGLDLEISKLTSDTESLTHV